MQMFDFALIEECMEDMCGLCASCGYVQTCVEPDACEYECEECGEPTVYGAEELVFMGAVS